MHPLRASYLARTGKFWVQDRSRSLAVALRFASISVESWIVINYLFTGLTGQCVGSQNS